MIEEIIAPIPSPLVMTLAGSIAAKHTQSYVYLLFIAVTGAIGKTFASYLLYVIADRFEDLVLKKFGKFFGVSHKEVERIGKHLNKGWKDDILIIILRAVPIIPSAPVSIVSGLIKMNLRTFITSTWIGTVLRNFIYLTIGFTGVNATESLIVKMEDFEIIGYLILIVFVLLIIGYLLFQRKKEVLLSKILGKHDQSDSHLSNNTKPKE